MSKIISIHAREVLDSRGNPTIEVDLALDDGSMGRAAVPSGASTGSHEAVELRDGDPKRYGGKGVLRAASNVNGRIRAAIVGKSFDQSALDHALIELDGSADKADLGANAVLGASMAFARAAARSAGEPLYRYFNSLSAARPPLLLPVPLTNVINGGRHAVGSADIQEFMLVPHGFKRFSDALRAADETFIALKSLLAERGLSTLVGDEGGFAMASASNAAPLDQLTAAIKKAGYEPGRDISLAVDVAASELLKDGSYELSREGKELDSKDMVDWLDRLSNGHPLVSIEDGLAEDDWDGWVKLTERLGSKLQLVGDDLFTTNVNRLGMGIDRRAGNAILIKPNQIGTITETLETVAMATKAGYRSIISHRSGETEDTTIADLAVGLGTGQIKTGSLSRSERLAKYNRLLRIEEELGDRAVYAQLFH